MFAVGFFFEGYFRGVSDGSDPGGAVAVETANRATHLASDRPNRKSARQSTGTRDFSLSEIVNLIRNAAPGDTTDEEVLATILEKLNKGIADDTWPRYKVMASIAKMVDDYPKLAFLLMGRLAPDSAGRAYQLSMIRTFASRDPDAALVFLCRHGPVGRGFEPMVHSVVVTLLRKHPSELMAWLRTHDTHEEELLVRKRTLSMLRSFGTDSEALPVLDLVLDDPGLSEDLRRAALRGRLEGTAELGASEWMKYIDSVTESWSDSKTVALVVGCWPDEMHEELVEFVNRLPRGEGKDSAMCILAGHYSESGRIEETLAAIRQINKPEVRKDVVQNSTINIFEENENAVAGYLESLPADADRSAAIDSIFPRLIINGKIHMAKRIAALEPDPQRRQEFLDQIDRVGRSRNPDSP